MSENPEHIAEHVRDTCIQAARKGYEDAAMAGLCGEGALEAALSAIEKLDPASLVPETTASDNTTRRDSEQE
ncbi:acetyltransferase [Salinisphaera orenii]|uniref:acetyltransferase n=1 Tax=Salinisphaera orenii TaxID=856731 RepID=UPI000DBE4DF0